MDTYFKYVAQIMDWLPSCVLYVWSEKWLPPRKLGSW